MTTPFGISSFSWENFLAAIENSFQEELDASKNEKVNYLFEYLEKIGVKTLISEFNYIDRDYIEDFANYYVRCFPDYKRRCRRIHFFKTDISEEAFLSIIRKKGTHGELGSFQVSYCGLIVIRPLPNAIIGRTVLKVYDKSKPDGERYYPCTRNYNVNLFGINLRLSSLAFQEQDSVIAACATVALWCCFHKTYELFRISLLSPSKITRLANQVVRSGRSIPSEGLDIHQICSAIRQVDLEPEVFKVEPVTPLISLIYAYLKMGLPVLLAVEIEETGYHAITVTGYSLQETKCHSREAPQSKSAVPVPMKGLRINEFYAHDDQKGPFSRLKALAPFPTADSIVLKNQPLKNQPTDEKLSIYFEGGWEKRGATLKIIPKVVVIPIYHKIRVTFMDVQLWLTTLQALLNTIIPKRSSMEWDVFVTTVNQYKENFTGLPLHQTKIDEVLLKQHPKFIWRSTLFYDGEPILELLTDATDMAHSLPVYQVIWFDDTEDIKDKFKEILEYGAPVKKVLTPKIFSLFEQSMECLT